MAITTAKWREERRTILAEIIEENSTKELSYREIADEMRRHPVVARSQPDYSTMTAYRDWLVIKDELVSRRRELASKYISDQLEITEQLLGDLLSEYEELEKAAKETDDIPDTSKRIRMRISIAGAKKRLVEAIDKLLYRQHTLIPIAVPKQLNVNNRTINFTLDDFHQLQNEALRELEDGNTIDGEFIEDG